MNLVQIDGNLTADPQVHRNSNGKTFVTFHIGETQGYYDQHRNWVKLPALYLSVIVNGRLAQNAAATLRRGSGALIVGHLVPNTWTDAEGDTHHGVQLKARSIGPSLAHATAEITHNTQSEASAVESPAEPTEPAAEPAAQPAKAAAKRTRATKRSKPAEPAEQERPAA